MSSKTRDVAKIVMCWATVLACGLSTSCFGEEDCSGIPEAPVVSGEYKLIHFAEYRKGEGLQGNWKGARDISAKVDRGAEAITITYESGAGEDVAEVWEIRESKFR